MKCKFCNNLIQLGEYYHHPSDYELHTPDHSNYYSGWCHHCPIPISYVWESSFTYPKLSVTHIITLCDSNYINNLPYYAFQLNYKDNRTFLTYSKFDGKGLDDIIVRLNHLVDINPINFNQKLKTYLTFS
jgi:hypothetical protein